MSKQSGLLAACAGTNLQNDAFFIIGIFGQQEQFYVFFQLFQFLAILAAFLLYHGKELRVLPARLQQIAGLPDLEFQLPVLTVAFH